MTRNFICQDTKSDKFWTIEVNGKSLTTTYGKNGKYNKSQTATKELGTDETCLKEAEKQISKKLKEKYEEVNLQIPNIPVYVLKQVQDAKEGKINELKINAIGSLDLLQEIFSISNLEELELSDIRELDTKKELPAELGNLSNLKKLEIKYSQITKLPAEIGRLKKLEELEFYKCKSLKELPSAIGDLINLKKLDLTFSSFESLPEEIGNLENLEELHVFSNNVNTLPATLTKLKKLKKLRLAEDWKELPSVVYQLENLEELNRVYTT